MFGSINKAHLFKKNDGTVKNVNKSKKDEQLFSNFKLPLPNETEHFFDENLSKNEFCGMDGICCNLSEQNSSDSSRSTLEQLKTSIISDVLMELKHSLVVEITNELKTKLIPEILTEIKSSLANVKSDD